ncbi:MAG: hypothetical protein GX270_08810 [Clostridiaceae bacterium]|jgi:hypothetical protein|nr:hypothetical protein [Clostridiaceae bacterium]
MIIAKIIRKIDFYKLLHPLTLVVTFPIIFTTFCFLTQSLSKGLILYACALLILILLLYLDMITETESAKIEEGSTNVITMNFSEEVAKKTIESFKDKKLLMYKN